MFCTWLSEFCKKLKLQGMVIYWDKYNKNAFLQANYRIKSYFCNNFWKIQWLPLCFFISKKIQPCAKLMGIYTISWEWECKMSVKKQR